MVCMLRQHCIDADLSLCANCDHSSLLQHSRMVWLDFTHTLLTILTVSVWPYRTKADLPLYSSDIPESERGQAINKLEKSLLNILGMKKRPTPSKRDVRVSPFMLDLYHKQNDDSDYMAYTFHDGDAYHANTARSFSHIGKQKIHLAIFCREPPGGYKMI